jgi:hypothetical protein
MLGPGIDERQGILVVEELPERVGRCDIRVLPTGGRDAAIGNAVVGRSDGRLPRFAKSLDRRSVEGDDGRRRELTA